MDIRFICLGRDRARRSLRILAVFVLILALYTFTSFAFAEKMTAYAETPSASASNSASYNAAYGPEKSEKPPVNLDILTSAPHPQLPKTLPEPPAKQWIFDQSRYTNSPVTGDRVLQYQAKTPAYRDPNAFYDSPHESYPFSPAPYGPYPRYAPPRYNGSTPYDQYSDPYRHYPLYNVDIYGP